MNISIIVPVYNVEKYLDYCLHSIRKQQLDEYEVLLIDDCSPDRCGEIWDRWAKRDPHFKVTHC
jgi:glycosyltransferase involved in cell wall biosynthesis